jgi:DNA-binding NtrC family response regulator
LRSKELHNILIIGKDPTSLFLTNELLQFDRHTIYAMSTAPAAITEFGKHNGQIQIVFCDAAVVRAGGLHLFDELRKKNNEVMIVVMASPSNLLKIGTMVEQYNINILLKPYRGRMLLQYVDGISRHPAV